MKEHGAAAPSDSWPRVVVDLDDKIIKAVFALEAVADLIVAANDRPVVVTISWIFGPRIDNTNRAHW